MRAMPSTSIPLSMSTSSTRSTQRWQHPRSYSACNTTHRRTPQFWCRAVLLCVCGFKPDALNQSCSPIALLTHPCDQAWHQHSWLSCVAGWWHSSRKRVVPHETAALLAEIQNSIHEHTQHFSDTVTNMRPKFAWSSASFSSARTLLIHHIFV